MPDPIGPNGLRFDNDPEKTRNHNTETQLAHNFTAEIAEVKKIIKNSGGEVPQNAQFVVVEKGDCLWDIAEEYNVDPQTLIDDNKQFQDNPDLIHPDEIVVVRLPDGNKAPESGGAVFGHQQQEKSEDINDSVQTTDIKNKAEGQWQQIEGDSIAFFSGIKDPKQRREALDSALTQATGRTRQEIVEGYLDTFTDKVECAKAGEDLRKAYPEDNAHPDNSYIVNGINNKIPFIPNENP